MSGWIWIDGVVVESDSPEAVVPALDRGLLLGEGVYETCKVVDGTPFALSRHLARLRRSAAGCRLEVPWSDEELRGAVREVIAAASRGSVEGSAPARRGQGRPSPSPHRRLRLRLRLRLTITGGAGPLGPSRGDPAPRLLVAVGDQAPWPPTSAVASVPWSIDEGGPLVGIKTTSRLDLIRCLDVAQERGADEAILTNRAGMLAEGAGSNLFLVTEGVLCTPSLATGCLAGVTRELVIDALRTGEHSVRPSVQPSVRPPGEDVAPVGAIVVDERDDLTLDDLRGASEAFLTSSTRDVHPIAVVDGSPLPASPGPLTIAASRALGSVEAATSDP